jgi:4-hydroxy-2-oxoheptanedioate aldolase
MLNPGKERLPEHLGDVGAIFIDREGTGLSLHDAQSAVQAARNRKLAAIIRTDGLSVDEIAACAELGPDGVVLPQVVQVQELAQAVDVLRPYSLCVIAQIETVEAVEALFELMDIDGVDAFLIGPNDLSEAMGFPGEPDHEVVRRTVEAVAADLASAERVFGLPTTSAEARQYWSGRGAQLHYAPLKAFLQMEKTTCP